MDGGYGFRDGSGKTSFGSLLRSIGDAFGYAPGWVNETRKTLAAEIEQRGLEARVEEALPSKCARPIILWLLIALIIGVGILVFLKR